MAPRTLLLARRSPKQVKSAKRSSGVEPTAVLKCTQKVANGALLIQQRCNGCHGVTVRDIVGSSLENGSIYKMADLKYDLKNGRLEALPAGSSAGPMPVGKTKTAAPRAGQPLPPVTLDEFFRFAQCQLRMEVREHTGKVLELSDKGAEAMWPDAVAFVTPNLGLTERWVPYHTILGVHELFLVTDVHARKDWTPEQKFLAMFIFRTHCKRDVFTKAQLPVMMKKGFWSDPKKAFAPGGPMEQAILKYRRSTNQPLITSCFRIIPPRVLKDNTKNLVRSITSRTEALLDVAAEAWPVLQSKMTPVERINRISSMMQNAQGCGETWAKMLTVCIDLAYPKQKFLETQCDVGTGAAPALKCLLGKAATGNKLDDLKALQKLVNGCKSKHAQHFWKTLKAAEAELQKKYKPFPLACAQMNTTQHSMTAGTLQVQLCEFRQYRHSIARLQHGMPEDEKMREEYEQKARIEAENFVELDAKQKAAVFEFPAISGKIPFEVPLSEVGGKQMVAARVAAMCFNKLREGGDKKDALKLRDELVEGYAGGEDVPDDSEAWHECKASRLKKSCPVCCFAFETSSGQKFPFQTTKGAAGSILESERVARLCWVKLQKGATKEQATEYRNQLYKKRNSGNAEVNTEGRPVIKRQKR